MIDPKRLKILASDRHREFRNLSGRLKRKKPSDLDQITIELHDIAFSYIDCLDCGNCCKSISPLLTDRDIQRMAVSLRMKPSEFTDRYLHLDEEGDYVFRFTPCPFLGKDNCCSVYENRPRACREYPHTDRKRFIQILDLSVKNTFICPAVFEVFDGLSRRYS